MFVKAMSINYHKLVEKMITKKQLLRVKSYDKMQLSKDKEGII